MKLKASIGHNAISEIPSQRISLCDLSRSFVMKELRLSSGNYALVDDEDFEYLNQWKWYEMKNGKTSYAFRTRSIKRDNRFITKSIMMHRVIMNPPDKMIIDHINHMGLDNRKENLRIVTQRENTMNRTIINKRGYIGVSFNGHNYIAHIRIGKLISYIGSFKTPLEAHNAYMKKAEELINKSSNELRFKFVETKNP
jgi:hypothetical protein